MSRNGWIGVDLDGTLAHYDKWVGVEHIGEPIGLMVQRVKNLLADGHQVKIFTARAHPLGKDSWEHQRGLVAINVWCLKHIGQILPITFEKDMWMTQLWDDRAVQIIPNTGIRADGCL